MTVTEINRRIRAERELADELQRYAGQWVAVREHRVIGHAPSPEKLEEQLAQEAKPYRTFRVTRGAGATLL